MADPRLARPSWRGRTNVDALTIACIEHAEQIVRDERPAIAHDFYVTQGSYQSGGGDVNSAGTHDLGGVVDLRWCGHDFCIEALRRAGMTATWHRTPAQGPWPHHIHAVVRDHPRQADSAKRQTASVLRGGNGLAYERPDDGPQLRPYPMPVWPWPQEDDMPTPEETRKIVREEIDRAVPEIAEKVAQAVLGADVISRLDVSVRQALRDVVDKPAARTNRKEK